MVCIFRFQLISHCLKVELVGGLGEVGAHRLPATPIRVAVLLSSPPWRPRESCDGGENCRSVCLPNLTITKHSVPKSTSLKNQNHKIGSLTYKRPKTPVSQCCLRGDVPGCEPVTTRNLCFRGVTSSRRADLHSDPYQVSRVQASNARHGHTQSTPFNFKIRHQWFHGYRCLVPL